MRSDDSGVDITEEEEAADEGAAGGPAAVGPLRLREVLNLE